MIEGTACDATTTFTETAESAVTMTALVESATKLSKVVTAERTTTSATASALVISAANKAGMDGIDRAAIDAIIMKESGNSLFMQQQRKRDEKVNAKIAVLRQRLQDQDHANSKTNECWRQSLERQVDVEIRDWLSMRPTRSCKVVVDMDMFYMACELLTRPDISNLPACVGGSSMILTSNYAARQYGVRSAMPGYIGEALVHQLSKGREKLVFCPSNFPLYQEKSQIVRQVLSEFDLNLTAYSLDEAYLDLAPYLFCHLTHPTWKHEQISAALVQQHHQQSAHKLMVAKDDGKDANVASPLAVGAVDEDGMSDATEVDTETVNCSDDTATFTTDNSLERLLEYSPDECLASAAVIVADMRDRVKIATGGLTCSAGLAPNFLLAKIASDRNKPDGQLLVASDMASVTDFLHPLPIRNVSGIGRVAEKILGAFHIATVRQLYEERALVRFLFQETNDSTASFLLKASVGCSSSDGKVSEDESSHQQQRGISRERTMQSGRTWAELNTKLEDIGRLLSDDMVKKNLSAHTITVKVKLHTFDCLSRSRTMPRGIFLQSAQDLVKIATELLHEIRQKQYQHNSKANAGGASTVFSVRLLGIRCSNFHGDDDDAAAAQQRQQMTMDQFFCDKAFKAPESSLNSGIPPPTTPVQGDMTRQVHATSHESISRLKRKNDDFNAFSPKTLSPHAVTAQSNNREATRSISLATAISTRVLARIKCPVCGKALTSADAEEDVAVNDQLNRHVDQCLNGTMIRQALREESFTSPPPPTKKKRARNDVSDFFPSRSSRR